MEPGIKIIPTSQEESGRAGAYPAAAPIVRPEARTFSDKLKSATWWGATYIAIGYVANAVFSTWLAVMAKQKYHNQVEQAGETLGRFYQKIGVYGGTHALEKGISNLKGGLICAGGFAFIPAMKWLEENREKVEYKIGNALKAIGIGKNHPQEEKKQEFTKDKVSWFKTLISRFAGVGLVTFFASNVRETETFIKFQTNLSEKLSHFIYRRPTVKNIGIRKAFAEDIVYTIVTAVTFSAGQYLFSRERRHEKEVIALGETKTGHEPVAVSFAGKIQPRLAHGSHVEALASMPVSVPALHA